MFLDNSAKEHWTLNTFKVNIFWVYLELLPLFKFGRSGTGDLGVSYGGGSELGEPEELKLDR